MAKKKKGRKKRPGGPPRPGGVPRTSRPPTQPEAEAAAAAAPVESAPGAADDRRTQSKARREAQRQKRIRQQRRKRMKIYAILALVVIGIIGLIGWRIYANQQEVAELNRIAAAAGCTPIRETGSSGADQHMSPGESYPDYDTSPPTHGRHWGTTLAAGVYEEPLATTVPATEQPTAPTMVQAVHSLEHGYIAIWHNGLEDSELSALLREFGTERKVIIAPYPDMERGQELALTAWGRMQTCSEDIDEDTTEVVDRFIDRFREARSAPEPISP